MEQLLPSVEVVSVWEFVQRALRRAFHNSWRSFVASPLRIALIAAALLASEAFYVVYSTLTLQMTLNRTAEGIYAEGRSVGVIIGSIVWPLPLALVGVVARAAFARRYYGAQAGKHPGPQQLLPLLLLELRMSLVIPLAALGGSLPGLLAMLLGAVTDTPLVLRVGVVVALVGAGAALAYVVPGVVFATRMVVLSGCSPRRALADNWAWAKGRRAPLVCLLSATYILELVGLAGLAVFALGVVITLPLARGFRDTLVTQVYLDFADHDEQLRRQKSGVRAFVQL